MIQMIRFFISSTFCDMFGERNLIHKEVLPKLRAFQRLRGEYVEICDLRWGLDHGQAKDIEKTNAIMQVCLKEIDECEPYFIAFLGDYYGTVLKENVVVKELKYGVSWLSPASEMSLTQIELEYAILKRQLDTSAKVRPICLFRHWKDDKKFIDQNENAADRQERQENLKKRLRALGDTGNITVIDYEAVWDRKKEEATGLERMASDLQYAAEKIIESVVQTSKPQNWIESEFLNASKFCKQHTTHFGGREYLKGKIISAIDEDETVHTICISGASGQGKSALMAKVYQEYQADHKNASLCFIACGYGERSRSYLDILKQLTYFAEKKIHPDYKISNAYSEEKAEDDLKQAILAYEKAGQNKLILLVDALDKVSCYGTVQIPYLMDGLDISKVTIICSRIESFRINKNNAVEVKIGELEKDDINKIVAEHVDRKDKNFDMLSGKLNEKGGKGSPLYIKAALNILLIETTIVRDKPNLFDYYLDLVRDMPEETEELIWNNIKKAGDYLDYQLCETLAGLLAAAKEGLREADLEGLWEIENEKQPDRVNWQTVDFVRFRYYLDAFFRCRSNGCWTFSHDKIKESVQIMQQDKLQDYQESILEYVKRMKTNKEYSLKNIKKNDLVLIIEGLWASQELEDYDLARTILEDAAGDENVQVYTQVMVTLHHIIGSVAGLKWYRTLSDKYPSTIEKILGKGLMHYGVVDYERRYPAKELSDIYQELQNRRMQQEHLLRTLREKPSLEEKIQFSSFCSEYVGIYDDISRQWQVLPYEVPIYELISKQVDFAELEEGQKCSIFKQVNGVFYANNRILNDIANGKLPAVPFEQELAEKISQGMIQWYNDKLLYKEFEFKDRSLTEGKFVNNIAQYYDAHKKYEIGYRYRLEAIKYKTGDFLNMIGQTYLLSKMERMIADRSAVDEHAKYWKNAEQLYNIYLMEKTLENETEEKSRRTSASAKWTRVAVSYRCIGSDYFNWDEIEENDNRLWNAYKVMKLSLDMLDIPVLEKNEKERIITKTLMIGICGKLFKRGLAEDGQEEFTTFIANTANDAVRHLKLDKRELSKLCKNINDYIQNVPTDADYYDRLIYARDSISAMI